MDNGKVNKYLHPLGDGFDRLLVEEQILQSRERAIRIDTATLAKDVTIS
jgi:hypothetical protein